MVKPGGQNKSSQQPINPVPALYNHVIKALLERTWEGDFNLHLQSCVMLCWFNIYIKYINRVMQTL